MALSDAQKWQALQRGRARIAAHAQATGSDFATAARAVQHGDRQAAAEQELIAYAAQLSPQHVEYLMRLDASGGGQAVISALQATGLSRDALEVAAATYDGSGGFNGLVQAVSGELQRVAQHNQATALESGIANATPNARDSGAVAQMKRGQLAEHARDRESAEAAQAMCQRYGIRVDPKVGPYVSLFNFIRDFNGGAVMNEHRNVGERKWTDDEAIRGLADLLGERPEDVRDLVGHFEALDMSHQLSTRFVAKDHSPEAEARRRYMSEQPKEIRADATSKGRRRSDLERRYDEFDRARPGEAPPPRKPAPKTETSRHRALSEAYSAVESGRAPSAPSPADHDPYESSRRASLAAAYDAIDSQPEEENAE